MFGNERRETGMQFEQIMVLNDGETFTSLQGCFIMAVPAGSSNEEIEEILDGCKMFDHNPGDFSEGFVVATFDEIPKLRGNNAT